MHFQFATEPLTVLFTTGQSNNCIPPTMASTFFDVMAIIAAAIEERDISALVFVRTVPSGCMALHLQGNLYLLTRLCRNEDGVYAEIVDIVEQP